MPEFLPSGLKNERLAPIIARLPALEEGGLVVQIRRFIQATHEAFFTTGWQSHAHFELGILRQGRMRYETRTFKTEVGKGQGVLIPAGVEHRRTTVKNPSLIDGWHLVFSARNPRAREALARLSQGLVKSRFRLEQTAPAMEAFEEIDDELRANPVFAESKLHTLLLKTPIHILRTLWPKAPAAPTQSTVLSPREGKLLSLARAFIDSKLSGPLVTRAVAQELGVGERYVNLLFEKAEERSCGEYIRERRLLLAYELIDLHPSLKILEIAHRVGIDDPLYFSKLFRRRFGLSAREVRDRRLG